MTQVDPAINKRPSPGSSLGTRFHALVARDFREYAELCLALAMILSPLIFVRSLLLDSFMLPKMTVLWVLGLGAAALWTCWALETRQAPPRPKIGMAAVGFIGAAGVATVLSQSPSMSLLGRYQRFGGFLPFALYVVIMWTVFGLYWRKPDGLKLLVQSTLLASLVSAVYVLIQASGHDWVKWRDPTSGGVFVRTGTLGNSDFSGGYLALTLPLFVYYFCICRDRKRKILILAGAGIVIMALWFTRNRGGMLAAAAGLAMIAFAYRERIARRFKIGIAAMLAALAMIAVVAVWHPGMREPPHAIKNAPILDSSTLQIRFWAWGAAWNAFSDHPIIGTGLDTYYLNYGRYRLAIDGARYGFNLNDKPHNIFLEYAANAGILGLGAYLCAVGLALFFGYRRARTIQGSDRLLLVAFLGMLVAYLAQGFFSIDIPSLAVMGWVAVGAIAAIADPRAIAGRELQASESLSTEGNQTGARRPNRRKEALQAAVAAVTVALIGIGLRPLLADRAAAAGQAIRAEKLNPLEPTYLGRAATIAEQQANTASDPALKKRLLNDSLSYYHKAMLLRPGLTALNLYVARVHSRWAREIDPGRFSRADLWWKKTVASDPKNWAVHREYSQFLAGWALATHSDAISRRALAEQAQLNRILSSIPSR